VTNSYKAPSTINTIGTICSLLTVCSQHCDCDVQQQHITSNAE